MWSVGNEVPERATPASLEIEKKLVARIKELDSTRPVTEAIPMWGMRRWQDADAAFAMLDVAGYNYEVGRYPADHQRDPKRVIAGTESYPSQAFLNWAAVNDNPYVIGDFVWTALDYLGESGIGRWIFQGEREIGHGNNNLYPWHGAYCGDLDLTGFRKPVSHYRNIL